MSESCAPCGYQMIRSLTIENFRGISFAQVESAKRINILVGQNATGKTAFLEAIFAAAGGSPELLLRTRGWRGREAAFQGDYRNLFNALWADTFRDPNIGTAHIELIGDHEETRSLTIKKTGFEKVISDSGEDEYAGGGVECIYESPTFGTQTVTPEIKAGSFHMGSVPSSLSVNFLGARVNISEAQSAQLYSQLRVEGKEKLFEKIFLSEFPFLSDLGLEAPHGPLAMYARHPSGRKLPLTMISGGINQLAAMMVRLAANPKGILVIDEIENGFYYDKHESIWRGLFRIAQSVEGQIFASTHSIECLLGLRAALKDNPDDVRFIRSSLEDDGTISMEEMGGDTLFNAIEMGEVR